MRQLRSANSPLKASTIDFSDFSTTSRALRSSSRRSPEFSAPLFGVETSPSLKRSWSAFSDDSNVSSVRGENRWDAKRRVRCQISGSQPRRSQRPFQLLTPVASPGDSYGYGNDDGEIMASFLDLPTEVHQYICEYLADDKDVASYAQVCVKTSLYISSSVWHKRFLSRFDPIEDPSAREAHRQYIERCGFEHIYLEFDDGPHPLHARFLCMLKDMIIQSDMRVSNDSEGTPHFDGRNHEWIRRLMADAEARRTRSWGTNLVDAICNVGALFPGGAPKSSRSTSSLVLVIQLCLLHLALDPNVCVARPPQIIESQQQVYKCFRDEPIFKGKNKGDINFPWLLHVANFFKFHFKTHEGEGLLAHMYDGLDKGELPRPWCGKIRGGTQELGKNWKGAFTYLGDEDLEDFRAGDGDAAVDEVHQDNNGFQDLTLFFDIKGHPELQFGPNLEKELHGMPDGRLRNEDKSLIEAKDFFGLGYNGRPYHFNGRVHAMPLQAGIPGFQRVTMMKCLPDEDGSYGYGRTSCWGYEGCVLPGNQIMLGRWWRAYASDEPSYSGPFIFWAVEGTAEDRLKDATTAVRFLDSMENKIIW